MEKSGLKFPNRYKKKSQNMQPLYLAVANEIYSFMMIKH